MVGWYSGWWRVRQCGSWMCERYVGMIGCGWNVLEEAIGKRECQTRIIVGSYTLPHLFQLFL